MTSTKQTSTTTLIVLLLGVVILVPLLTMGGGMMGVAGIGMLGGGMLLWPLLLIGVVFLIFYGVVGETETTTEDDAVETLRDRYARGEITDEEFEEQRQTLRSQHDSRRSR